MAKCPKCNKSIFDGQFRCDHCGVIIALAEAEAKKEEKKTVKGGKEKK